MNAVNQFPDINPAAQIVTSTAFAAQSYRPRNLRPWFGLITVNSDLNDMVADNAEVILSRHRIRTESVEFTATGANIGVSSMGADHIRHRVILDTLHAEGTVIDHMVLTQRVANPATNFSRTIADLVNAGFNKVITRLQRLFLEQSYKMHGDFDSEDSQVATVAQLQEIQTIFAREDSFSDSRRLILLTSTEDVSAIKNNVARQDRSQFPEESERAQLEPVISLLGIANYRFAGVFQRFFVFIDDQLAYNPVAYDYLPVSNAAGDAPDPTIYTTGGKLSVVSGTNLRQLERLPISEGNGIQLNLPVTTVGTSRSTLHIRKGSLFVVDNIPNNENRAQRIFTVAEELIIRPQYTATTGTAVTQVTANLVVTGTPLDIQAAADSTVTLTSDTNLTFLTHLKHSIATERESAIIPNRVLYSHERLIGSFDQVRPTIVGMGGEHRFRDRFQIPTGFEGQGDSLTTIGGEETGVDYGLKFVSADRRTSVYMSLIMTLIVQWPEFTLKIINGPLRNPQVIDARDDFTTPREDIVRLGFRS